MLFVGIDLGTYLCRFILAKQIDDLNQLHKNKKTLEKIDMPIMLNERYDENFMVIDYKTAIVNFGVMEPGKPVMKTTLARINRIFEKLSEYINNLEEPFEIRCVATAALRYSPQSEDIIENIYRKFNIKVEIIDSKHEIYLAALGCRDYIHEESLILDIGSGSTEIAHVIYEKGQLIIKDYISLNLGLINNTTKSEIRQDAFNMITNFIKPYKNLPIVCSKCNTLKIAYNYFHNKKDNNVDGKYFDIDDLASITKFFNRMNNANLATIPTIGIRKIRLIKSGLPWVCAILKQLDVNGVILSEYGLKEGIILDMIARNKNENLENRGKNYSKHVESENLKFNHLKVNKKINVQNVENKNHNHNFKKTSNHLKNSKQKNFEKNHNANSNKDSKQYLKDEKKVSNEEA